jgi:hypothetical protein
VADARSRAPADHAAAENLTAGADCRDGRRKTVRGLRGRLPRPSVAGGARGVAARIGHDWTGKHTIVTGFLSTYSTAASKMPCFA